MKPVSAAVGSLSTFTFLRLIQSLSVALSTDVKPDPQELCQFETFNASCPDSSVILMQSARYGRMSLGRCIDTDVYIGCSADVMAHMDNRCSGRPNCLIPIPDSTLHQQQPCPNDMMAYLEASYACIQVTEQDGHCKDGKSVQSGLSEGYLASFTAQQSIQGTSKCPWVIVVKPGQKIDMYILDFSTTSRYTVESKFSFNPDAEYCHIYATLTEADRSKEFTVCAGTSREKLVYQSQTNSVSVQLSEPIVADRSVNFLIKYSATGCADLDPPKNSWIKRVNDRVTVTCNFTSHTWHLVCRGTTWVGHDAANQCNKSPSTDKITHGQSFPAYVFSFNCAGLVTAVITGVFIGAVCGFSLLGAVLWCKRQAEHNARPKPGDLHEMMLRSAEEQTDHGPCKVHHRLEGGEYGYTHVWEITGAGGGGGGRDGMHPVLVPHQACRYPSSPTGQGMGTTSPDSAYQTSLGQVSSTAREPVNSGGGAAVCAHHKEHIYESPTFDGNFLNRMNSYPYYCRSVPRGSPCHHGLHQQQQPLGQQMQQPLQHQAADGSIPNVVAVPRRGGCVAGAKEASDRPARGMHGSRYSLSEDTDDDDKYQLSFAKGPGYAPVCSSSDLDITQKPRTENHYT